MEKEKEKSSSSSNSSHSSMSSSSSGCSSLDNTRKKLERDEKGKLLPGQESLNPEGRPKGSLSIKSYIKKHLDDNPKEFEKLCKYYMNDTKMRDLLWKMIDGLPKQSIELGVDETISEVNIKIVKNENSKPEEHDSI